MTIGFGGCFLDAHISTHTLTWSVTKTISEIFEELINFNSHAHVERDEKDISKKI